MVITLERAIKIITQHGNLNEIYDFFKQLGTKKDYKLKDISLFSLIWFTMIVYLLLIF